MRLQLGPWLPDVLALESPGVALVRNAIPTPTHYRPVRNFHAVTSQELPDPIQGMVTARLFNGDEWQIVGANNRLWRVPSRNGVLVDLSLGGLDYTFSATNRWRFAHLAGWLVATNGAAPMQGLYLETATAFENLSAEAPKARYLATVRNQLIAGYITDVDGTDAYKVRWSGFTDGLPDPTAWAYSAEKLTDFQQVADIGILRGLTGGEFGLVLAEYGVARMTFVGGTDIFEFATIERGRGCFADSSVVQYGTDTYYLASEGWMRCDGARVIPIGREKIDRWFWADFELGNEDGIVAYADPGEGLIYWLYHGVGNTGAPNRMLIYSPILDQWSVADVTADWLGQVINFALSLDDTEEFPDLSTDTRNLADPKLWAQMMVSGGVANDKLVSFSGTIKPATFVLPEVSLAEGRRGVLTRATVLHEAGTAVLRIGTRERTTDAQRWSGLHEQQDDGTIRFREIGRFHQIRVEMSGSWEKLQAVEIAGRPLGER